MRVVLGATLAIPFLVVSLLAAGKPEPAPPAPVPAQILAAKTVFIVNDGADRGAYPDALFSGEPERAYNDFYAAMKAWGHYELVGSPSGADLLLELRFTVRPGWVAQFRLAIRDQKSHAKLWALTEQVEFANLQGGRDKNFDQALARLVADVKRLTAPSTAAPPNGQ
jgi:hypothetical protein